MDPSEPTPAQPAPTIDRCQRIRRPKKRASTDPTAAPIATDGPSCPHEPPLPIVMPVPTPTTTAWRPPMRPPPRAIASITSDASKSKAP